MKDIITEPGSAKHDMTLELLILESAVLLESGSEFIFEKFESSPALLSVSAPALLTSASALPAPVFYLQQINRIKVSILRVGHYNKI